MDTRRRPLGFPLFQEGVLLVDGLEAAALQHRVLGVLDRVLDRALAVGVAHPGRVGDDAVVGQHVPVDGVQFRFVQVGLDDAFLEVVEYDVSGGSTEVPEGLFVQLGPSLLRRVPDHAPEAAPRIAQRHHEQAWPPVTVTAGDARQCTFAVVDLGLFAGGELKPVELLRLALHQPTGEALDAVVAAGEAELVDQVLVDRRVVATQAQLGLDERAVRFAQRLRSAVDCLWPGWGNFNGGAGGRGGGICFS